MKLVTELWINYPESESQDEATCEGRFLRLILASGNSTPVPPNSNRVGAGVGPPQASALLPAAHAYLNLVD
jgi:hypothetical protein